MHVSHLMYADDVIFFGEWSRNNAHNLICMLRCFNLTSGLKINVHKSKVLGLGVPDVEVGCNMSRYGYCKNHKKMAKTGQTRTRERIEYTRAGRKIWWVLWWFIYSGSVGTRSVVWGGSCAAGVGRRSVGCCGGCGVKGNGGFRKTVSKTKYGLFEVLIVSKWNSKVWVVPSSFLRESGRWNGCLSVIWVRISLQSTVKEFACSMK
ncbi:hypothetical protein Tco_0852156 [Tanacetum coccineum]